jgi:hypothetical protein
MISTERTGAAWRQAMSWVMQGTPTVEVNRLMSLIVISYINIQLKDTKLLSAFIEQQR